MLLWKTYQKILGNHVSQQQQLISHIGQSIPSLQMVHIAPSDMTTWWYMCLENVCCCTKRWQGWGKVSIHLYLIVPTAQGQINKYITIHACFWADFFIPWENINRSGWWYHWSPKASSNTYPSPCSCTCMLQYRQIGRGMCDGVLTPILGTMDMIWGRELHCNSQL